MKEFVGIVHFEKLFEKLPECIVIRNLEPAEFLSIIPNKTLCGK